MSRARELARLGNTNAISVDTSNNIGIGTTTSIQYKLDVVGDANFVGVLTATSFGGDGSNLTGVAATDNINTNNIAISGIATVGTSITLRDGAINVTGVLTATSFGGDGSNLTGVADTGYINAVSVNASGIITANSFKGDGSALTGVAATDYVVANTLKVLGVSTFVGNTQLTATTASTSSATGALVVSGGVGIAGSLHVGENVSVGGTLTYEDVTNIDSVGIITARAGVLVNGGRGINVAAGGINVVGVATIGTGLSLTDDIKARFGAAGDLSIYHDGSHSYLNETGTGALKLKGDDIRLENASGNNIIKANTNVAELFHNGSIKLNTLSTGVAVVGVVSATTLTGDGSGLTNLPSAGLTTSASTSAGIVSTLALSSAQDHKVTVSGISTFTCSGGTEGDSHTLRITNSGVTTVGFSTYFLWPSGSSPSIPIADGTVSLISFTVHRVGTPGIATQLLAGASVNYS